MRTIHIYKVGQETWISPQQLWQAIKSGEETTLLAHSAQINIPRALEKAIGCLRQTARSIICAAVGGCLWSLAVVGLVTWPPIVARMLPEVQDAIRLGGAAGAALCGSVSLYYLRELWRLRCVLVKCPVRAGHALPPPVIALRQPPHRLPKPTVPILILIAAIALNGIVIASPLAPAVIWAADGTHLAERSTWVTPFTKWEQRSYYPTGSAMAYFATEGDPANIIWVIQVDYYVYRPDIMAEYDDWDGWIGSMLNIVVYNARNNIAAQMEQTPDPDARHAKTIEAFQDEAFHKGLEDALFQWFGQRYDGLYLRGVTVSVRRLTMAQYQAALRD